MVLVRINDDESRSVQELLALSPQEAMAVSETKGVSVAFPGEDGMVVEGSLTADEPGRYAALCFIPLGADPAGEAAANPPTDGPPELEGGPPHFTVGMVGELTVE